MRILLTGGSGCGKSTFAARLAASRPGPRTYIAAMRPSGPESERKKARDRAMLEDGVSHVVEQYTGLKDLKIPKGGTVLLECLCTLTANEMFDAAGRRTDPVPAVLEGLDRLAVQCEDLLAVTNEVGSGFGRYRDGTPAYIRALGEINSRAADRFDTVLELVCGVPILRKGELELPPHIKGDTKMTLVVGAAASGKKDYVKSLGYGEADFSPDPDSAAPVLTGLQTLVDRDPMAAEALLPRLLAKEVVICSEVGCGIIPDNEHDRVSREQTGRLCCLLARRAERVVRLMCGIPMYMK